MRKRRGKEGEKEREAPFSLLFATSRGIHKNGFGEEKDKRQLNSKEEERKSKHSSPSFGPAGASSNIVYFQAKERWYNICGILHCMCKRNIPWETCKRGTFSDFSYFPKKTLHSIMAVASREYSPATRNPPPLSNHALQRERRRVCVTPSTTPVSNLRAFASQFPWRLTYSLPE